MSNNILESAKRAAAESNSWADLTNVLFDPRNGLITKAYPGRAEREAYMKTPEYQAIRSLLLDEMKRTGVVEGATPEKSGRFVVRVPKSLHAALDREATAEGVSLNQLVVTKLAVSLSQLESGARPELAIVAQAFLETREGYSVDRVIADPGINQRYLNRCRELDARGTDFDLNWQLMHARKNGHLSETPKTKRYSPKGIDDFEFSSEIALVHVKHQADVERRELITLDKVLCDPELATLFDEIAEQLAPGHSKLEYRWAALKVRKAAGRDFSMVKKAKLPSFEDIGNTKSVRLSKIPDEQGIYVFRNQDDAVFVSHTDNLRTRVDRHLEYSDSRGLPEWVYESQKRGLELALVPTPGLRLKTRKQMELKTVLEFKPLLNVPAGTRSSGQDG
jgi:hypothetical protein